MPQTPSSFKFRQTENNATQTGNVLRADKSDTHTRARGPGTPLAHIPNQRIEEALRLNGGMMTAAARELKVSRDRLYDRIKVEPELQRIRDDIREEAIDLAESQLFK